MRAPVSAAAAALIAAAFGAPAATAAPPANDHYLGATPLNGPGSKMPRDTVTSPATDTSEATLQADLLAPPAAGGPPEPSSCESRPLDRTVWYRFFPDVDGRVRVQAVGFDATLALVPFASAAAPLPQGYTCANRRDDTIETLEAPVQRGLGYAVQAGGTAGAAGVLQVAFTFLPDRDGDGVSDELDRCPRRPGTANGCPPKIIARISYKYDGVANGVRFHRLDVNDAPRGAALEVRCSRGCRRRRLTVRSRVTHVKAFRGRFMPVGVTIEVRVTKAGYIGDYHKFTVSAGNVTSTDRCLQPGSTVPRRSASPPIRAPVPTSSRRACRRASGRCRP